MTTRETERQAIREAIERLITGTPVRSTGALTVLQLANEAGIKRWVLTHKHPDLKTEFEHRRTEANGIPAAFQSTHARSLDLETANQALREENARLAERVEVYAQVIAELSTRIERLQLELTRPDNVRRLPTPRTRSTSDISAISPGPLRATVRGDAEAPADEERAHLARQAHDAPQHERHS